MIIVITVHMKRFACFLSVFNSIDFFIASLNRIYINFIQYIIFNNVFYLFNDIHTEKSIVFYR